ncbi:hypothetical protein [Clostridium sp. AM42-4]|uniref:hypothetical protein n=1 Tax=Clostridium sp. AM42-4 TaxID=2292305 RepID=UPI000E4AC5F4|nr:hypothetical protein [Clostridium sp. AM42-4]RHS90196.1 hypothetical protein DW922_03755 [Clostridium sp. AM42-4]
MPINMTDYRMILRGRVYNVLQIVLVTRFEDGDDAPTVKYIEAVYIDEDGSIKILRDEPQYFQFLRRVEAKQKES